MTIQRHETETDLSNLIAVAAGILAAAGGLIHLAVSGQHAGLPFVAAGFIVMAAAQGAFMVAVLRRPTRPVVILGGILHFAIAAAWILSRTIGLGLVPGAENAAAVGVTDMVANTFSIGVVGLTVIWIAIRRWDRATTLSTEARRIIVATFVAGTLFLMVPALAAPHDHHSHTPFQLPGQTGDGHQHDGDLTTTTEHDH